MDTITVLAGLIGIIVGVLTLVKEWPLIEKWLYSTKNRIKRNARKNMNRRTVIGGVAVGIVGASSYALFPSISSAIRSIQRKQCPADGDHFVKNEQTGVIHHFEVCKSHLPKRQLAVLPDELPPSEFLHSSKYVHIASIELTEVDSEAVIISAINKSPTSTHLYKFLIKKWGREKKYAKIHELLESSIEYLGALLVKSENDLRLTAKYKKAIQELEQRRDKALFQLRLKNI